MTSRYGRAWLAIVSLAVVACSPGTDQQAAAAGASAGNGNRPQPSLSIAGVSADEGDSGATPFNFRVALSAATDDTVRVRYRTEAGSATAGEDFTGATGELVFAPGATEQVLAVDVHGDTEIEPDEGFTVRLFGANHAQLANDSAEGLILDDDTPVSVVSVADAQAAEDGGTLNFVVSIAPPAPRPIAVDYATADGTALAGADYAAAAGRLEIPAGAATAQVAVALEDDAFDENDETFTLSLSNPQRATLGDGEATGTIRDDDDKGLLRAGAARRSVTPSPQHIDGVVEPRLDGTTRLQRFNLGGFGINPLQNLPDDPFGGMQQASEALTQPAEAPVFDGSRGPEDTHLRLLVLEQADGTRVAFVMLDAVGAGNLVQKGVKEAINAAACELGACFAPAGTPGENIGNIVFGQTHTHAGADLQGLWGGVPQDWVVNTLYAQAADATREAVAGLRPARLTFQQGHTVEFNNYRRPRYDLDADADGTLTLVTAAADDGTPVGSILQYNAHPTSINEDPRIPHADYVQGAMDWLEDAHTGSGGVALYYNGPIADASGSGGRAGCERVPSDADYGNVRCRGEGMASAAQQFAPQELAPSLVAQHVEVTLPITNAGFVALGLIGSFNRYYDFLMLPANEIPGVGPLVAAEQVNLPQLTPVAKTLVSRITLGGAEQGLEIVTIPGEATNTFGQYIRGLTGNRNMMLLGLTQNSFGYIIPEEEFNYLDPSGEAGLVAPFTGYEENVSLGPLTAPLLRFQGYHPLFGIGPDDARNLPPVLLACAGDPMAEQCVLNNIGARIEYIQNAYADQCRGLGGPEAFCQLFDPQTPLYDMCKDAGFAEETCRALGEPGAGGGDPDAALAAAAADALARGCDILDPSHCLLPFPSDHFTVAAAPGSAQSAERGGTGRRVEINPLATPRAGGAKPLDPSEWNRNDGFSPGQQITAYVPGVATVKDAQGNPTGPVVGAPPITNPGASLDVAGSSVLVLDAATGEPHPVWAEIDLNAGYLLPADKVDNPDPTKDARPALIIRPAKNFAEGRRYVVVLKNLRHDATGATLAAGAAFRTCRDGLATQLPPVQQRCAALAETVFPVLQQAGIAVAGNEGLYLAWDFTTASAENNVGRLRHMRDDAFLNYLGQVEDAAGRIVNLGRAPAFQVTQVTESNGERTVQGSFTVPSYVLPSDPSPLERERELRAQLKAQFPGLAPLIDAFDNVPRQAWSVSTPPNRLFYDPADNPNPSDPQGQRYGDGLPDRTGEMTTTFTCRLPRNASSATRPIVYGHGLLGGQEERGPDHDYDLMYCKADWFGFAFGDIPNVVSTLFDMSNFPVIPDASQQGMLNQLFFARLLRHPQGFVADPAFRDGAGTPLFDHREVFYDGNSQGGILGGVVVAMSKDITRGVLGVVGMNYSTLLQRSVDYDGQLAIGIPPYSLPTYLGYQDDLERQLVFSMIQMLWDRSENNGYAHHLADNAALRGPDNQLLLHPAFADHQVTMWSAHVMGRTVGVDLADMYPRKPGENATYTFSDKWGFFAQRDPDDPDFWGLPLVGREPAAYDAAGCSGTDCRTTTSGLVEFDEGRTAVPPIGNVPPRADDFDPHGWPRGTIFGRCQKSHFLHTQGRLIDVRGARNVTSAAECPALPPAVTPPPVPVAGDPVIPPFPFNPCAPDAIPGIGGECLLDVPVLGDALQDAWAFLNGDEPPEPELPGGDDVEPVVTELAENVQALPGDLEASAQVLADNAAAGALADRDAEAIVMEGRQFPDWSQPAAQGVAMPYPNGALTGERDAHAGVMLYPPPGFTGLPTAAPVNEIVAYRRENDAWVEIPVQVDERFPYFLANPNSDFGIYSGTDTELTYAWDRETWKADGGCFVDEASVAPTPDPVPGLDDDDEIAFMARDAGELADPALAGPEGTVGGGQQVALTDPLAPGAPRYVYLFRKPAGPTFSVYYVDYARDANADQFIDRSFFEGGPETDPYERNALGTSNTGYGPNLSGVVCWDGVTPRDSSDRFPRDGVTVSTDKYQLVASGRWMVRDVKIARPGQPRAYGADIVDRWKGRAFQQSPDSTISLVGFEDEQVNWEANSALLGERLGPVRAIREVWGADSGTNVTKTETYYSDAYSYRYRVRVHPIPPDGLYTSWDYNRGAMVPAPGEDVPGGRYYTAVRGLGVPIDGENDDVGNVDGLGDTPAYFDMADPTLNLPLAMYNWEQVSAKGDLGSLVYLFELKSPTIGANAAAVPYYRDDACLDDGTGDDPVPRPWPGEASTDARVRNAYSALAGGTPYEQLRCEQKQGAHAQHGVHFFAPPESDNAFAPVAVDEIDGQQWAFAVPTSEPTNVGERYANLVRAPLVRAVTPRPPGDGGEGEPSPVDTLVGLLEAGAEIVTEFIAAVIDDPASAPDAADEAAGELAGEVAGLIGGDAPEGDGRVHVGVGVVDMTPDVGYGAGQYTSENTGLLEGLAGGDMDPYATSKKQNKSYGVMSRLTARAIVVEGANGKRIVLLKSDNYLAQDSLLRRVGQLLEEHGSSLRYDQILYHVTHAHSTSYYSTPSWGVWAFQDAFDARFFEFQARRLAAAILLAERDLKPARMGATSVRHKVFKGQIMGPARGDDGTPVQYPNEYGDLGLVVVRFEADDAARTPIAAWVNWGEHPEGLDGYDLHSADFVAFLERFVDRELGAPLVFSQGDVGSAEKSGNPGQRIADDGTVCNDEPGESCAEGEGVWRDWNHAGYVQNERNVRFLADAVIKGWKVIGGELPVDARAQGIRPNDYVPEVQVPLSGSFPVDYRNAFIPGPLSHPYPSVSNCRSEASAEGNPGAPVVGLPDCARANDTDDRGVLLWETLKAEGLPLPEHYDAPAFAGVEENLRLKLQAFRMGDIVLGSCACEAQVDLILNFESRANDVEGDIYDGFDWACVAEDKGLLPADPAHAQACTLQREQYFDVREFPTPVPGDNFAPEAIARMRAQVHNDARGWDAPEYAPYANAEPADPALIKGNFTREELPAGRGYKLAIGVGHAGDYNGYTVSYREYMSHDHYRKALTSYGAHTADYMVTRLVRMAGAMKGGAELAPEPLDALAAVDEARMVAESTALGQVTSTAYESVLAALPPDVGPAQAAAQPRAISRFEAATFTWRGGSTAVDNPRVVVERQADGVWQPFADQSGEVQVRVHWPQGLDGVAATYAGQQEWLWSANFEAYEAFPARLGSTPAGTYRFAVAGCINSDLQAGAMDRLTGWLGGLLPQSLAELAGLEAGACPGGATAYAVTSDAFEVTADVELVTGVAMDAGGDLEIQVSPRSIPQTYASAFPYVNAGGDNGRFCEECSFRPWAASTAAPVAVTVEAGGVVHEAVREGELWRADVNLLPGQVATITASYADGRVGRPHFYTAGAGLP